MFIFKILYNVYSQQIKVSVVTDDDNDGLKNCCKTIYKFINKGSIVTPIIMHFWDMATDLAVICDWIPQANWCMFCFLFLHTN